ncbi:type II secretion system F family protein [Streptomyces hoynatensis]|uniref:type II secretion system F family protein n=1 Tax=Streptomyces hoynatensis TaxID=1141874 RepID=UPI001F4EA7A9|nr:type II secretion system F family protein [Streptomyces hoynatensis]
MSGASAAAWPAVVAGAAGAESGAALSATLLALLALAGVCRLSARRRLLGRLAALRGERPVPARLIPTPLRRRGRPTADHRLPLATELLAACLAAGAAPGAAAGAVGASLGGPLGESLRRAAAELRLGGDPSEVWGRFGRYPGAGGLARRLELAETSGAPMVRAVAAEAAQARARRRRAAQVGARRAAVQVAGPLGLCFLPAFLLIGVAPVVLGLAWRLL